MKTFTDAAMAAIERGDAIVAGACYIGAETPVCLWSGEGTLPLEDGSYLGIGNRALAQISGAAVGSAAAGINLTLSGIDPDVLDDFDEDEIRDAPVALRRLIFDSSGTQLLDAHVFDRGRVDQVASDETIGGEAAINVSVEGAARGLGRRGGRMRTDADQRLIDPADGGMRKVSFAGSITLYWGGVRPNTATNALPGAGLRGVNFGDLRISRA